AHTAPARCNTRTGTQRCLRGAVVALQGMRRGVQEAWGLPAPECGPAAARPGHEEERHREPHEKDEKVNINGLIRSCRACPDGAASLVCHFSDYLPTFQHYLSPVPVDNGLIGTVKEPSLL